MATHTLALVGAAGGVGTTRLSVEFGGTLARAGYDVAIFDAAFTTQGLSSYVEGAIEADVTALVTSEAQLDEALYEHPAETPGRLALCPARAPFERQARAKTAGAAERFEHQLAAGALAHDFVLVDTPPVGTNQALAAVNAVDDVAIVTPDSERGMDALAMTRERLADVGAKATALVANRTHAELLDADVRIPESETVRPRACPACLDPDDQFAPAVAEAVETLLDVDCDLEFPDGSRFGGLVGSNS